RWINTQELRRQLADPGLDENEFRRLALNQWTQSKDSWFPGDLWPSLKTEDLIPERADVYLGVDVGLYHDTTALVWAWPDPDGRMQLGCRVWAADPDAPAHTHVPGQAIELEEIEQFILERLQERFRIREIAYDPTFFARSAEMLSKRGYRLVQYFPQNTVTR